MKNLFYSASEKILFWIAGHTGDLNTDNPAQKIKFMQENTADFMRISAEIKPEKIGTFEVTKSQRYKYMRVYYATDIETPPAEAFCISGENGWKMQNWIHD